MREGAFEVVFISLPCVGLEVFISLFCVGAVVFISLFCVGAVVFISLFCVGLVVFISLFCVGAVLLFLRVGAVFGAEPLCVGVAEVPPLFVGVVGVPLALRVGAVLLPLLMPVGVGWAPDEGACAGCSILGLSTPGVHVLAGRGAGSCGARM